MRQNPERVAWVLLSLAFTLFCLLAVGIPLAIRWHRLHAVDEHGASVESLVGTVVVEPSAGRGPAPLAAGESTLVPEGTSIRVDETAEAVVTFFDYGRSALPGSFMRIFSGTSIRLDRLCSPRYPQGTQPNTVHLQLLGGRVSLGTTLSPDLPLDFRVTTLHGEFVLAADGTYELQATNELSEITVHRGHATALASGRRVNLGPRQRTAVELGQPPQPAMSAARNMVDNGDFRSPLSEGWRTFNDQGADGGDVDGSWEVVVDEGRRGIRLLRTGAPDNHCETILEQTINQQLPDLVASLTVRATVKVRYQSLSGGGYLSSEYPLMIRITYRDVYDSEAEWVHGFYYQNVANNPTTYGQQIPHDRWYLFESENLLDTLPIKPFRIMAIRVYAAGWDYESLVTDIGLIVE